MGAGEVRAGALSLCLAVWLLLAAGVAGHAQTPPPAAPTPVSAPASSQPRPMPGFVSAFEIIHTVRSAGFHPLSPPMREGTIYVLRATDYRGIPMRVVLDARTGMIRNATPIVASAAYGMPPQAYGPRPYDAGPYGAPYGAPTGYGGSVPGSEALEGSVVPPPQPAAVSTSGRVPPAMQPSLPLPRPRPAVLASKTTKGPENSGSLKAVPALNSSGKIQPPAAKPVSAGASETAARSKSAPAAPAKPSPVPPLTIAN